MLCFSIISNPRLRKFLGRIRTAFKEIAPKPHRFWQSVESSKEYEKKITEATLLFVDFFKAFNSIWRGKMEQILLAYDLTKETINFIIVLYKSTKAMVPSPDVT